MGARYLSGKWIYRIEWRDLVWMPGRVYEERSMNLISDTLPDDAVVVPEEAMRALPGFLNESGFLKPHLDERLRSEDLKITHRLLDVIDGLTFKKGKSEGARSG